MSKGKVPSPLTIFRGHLDIINCVEFIHVNIFASGSVDGEIHVWNLNTKTNLCRSIDVNRNSIISLNRCDNISLKFISLSRNDKLRVWDINHSLSHAVSQFNIDSHHFCNASNDPDSNNNIVVTPSSIENEILLWDLRSNSFIHKIQPSNTGSGIDHGMVTSLLLRNHLQNSSDILYAGYEDGMINVFDLRNYRPFALDKDKSHNAPVLSMDVVNVKSNCVESDTTSQIKLASVGADNQIIQHKMNFINMVNDPFNGNQNTSSLSNISPIDSNRSDSLLSMSIQHSQRAVSDNNVLIQDTKLRKEDLNFCKHILPTEGTSSSRYRPDGRILLTGHWDNTVRLYDAVKLKPLAILNHHRDNVMAVCFVPNFPDEDGAHNKFSNMFITASKDKTIALWNLYCDS